MSALRITVESANGREVRMPPINATSAMDVLIAAQRMFYSSKGDVLVECQTLDTVKHCNVHPNSIKQ